MDDGPSGRADFGTPIRQVPSGAFVIALFHSPEFFHQVSGRANLALAGHTHGGQIHIPFVHPFWLPTGCDGMLAGWYQERGTRLYVTRGVGMSFMPIRFLCRPEVDFITLLPDGTAPHLQTTPSAASTVKPDTPAAGHQLRPYRQASQAGS